MIPFFIASQKWNCTMGVAENDSASINSSGSNGDKRTYEKCITLRAVEEYRWYDGRWVIYLNFAGYSNR
jgi:GMP synthase PP-ATPase subunit